jgi:hypothetical protein
LVITLLKTLKREVKRESGERIEEKGGVEV